MGKKAQKDRRDAGPAKAEWFDRANPTGTTDAGETGLRFACTGCGDCCSGPPGYVLFTPKEGRAIAKLLGIELDEFIETHTTDTSEGRSIRDEKNTDRPGYDCIFLDRTTKPGKAICSIYRARPTQCRTWPFWGSNLKSKAAWREAGKSCPGMNTGTLYDPASIRLTRDRVEI